MKKLLPFVLVIILAVIICPLSGQAFPKSDQDCTTCHTLTADKAAKTLQELIPDVKIIEVNPGPLKGLWEVAIATRGQKGIVYIDFSGRKIISGNVIDIATKTNYTTESYSRINKVDVSQIPLNEAVVMGDKNAPVKVIVFDDPE